MELKQSNKIPNEEQHTSLPLYSVQGPLRYVLETRLVKIEMLRPREIVL